MATDDELVPLGDGPVASVLAGVDPATGAGYALKVFPAGLDRRTRSRARAELARLAALGDTPSLLPAWRLDALPDGRVALRMDLCAQSLPELLDSFGPLSTSDTVVLGCALAKALVALHGAGLVHGGVTPGNVLFRVSGEPVLSDAGVVLREAFPRDRIRAAGHLAPETLRDGTVDARSDLYGLGAILYLALAGRSPHDGPAGERPDARLLRVLDSPAPPPARAGLPPELDALTTELLARDPAERPADAASVLRRLGTLRATLNAPSPAAPPARTAPAPDPGPPPPAGASAPAPHAYLARHAHPAPPAGDPTPPPARHARPAPGNPTGGPTPLPATGPAALTDPAPRPPVGPTPPVGPLRQPAADWVSPPAVDRAQPSAAGPVAQDGPPGETTPDTAGRTASAGDRGRQSPTADAEALPGGEPTFDDPPAASPWPYGIAPEEPEPPREQATGPTPDGEPILVFGPLRAPRRFARVSLAVALTVAAVVALIAVSTALLMNEPDELAVPPAPARSAGSAPGPLPSRVVQLELADPVDRGNYVELSWRSSEPLDFAVIVAAEGEKAKAVFVHRSTSYRMEVDPARKYCFLIQGADGVQVHNSAPKAIRGATCSQQGTRGAAEPTG
ncbi:hypothetical protein Val02_53090 [Virgisporangium aliadipatigenens]|uniref:non-specific serine/threonine protein kinase n=1 Tax=Virgisporangium aliadipatigenens TaxID=741659 RepID=A0A8J3YQE4_9ACTN|nr:protein kinase [Virgisporangium aliadipatigenens]GIJ48423.1 hypothetical protein Val02_53090 [Virgisporangium aliadipatigenens]